MPGPMELLDDVRCFLKSRVILTATELDVFTCLEEASGGAAELADKFGTDLRATTRLLDCLITFDLLTKENGRYRLTKAGSFLSSHHPESVRPMVIHLNHIWRNWSQLTECVKTGTNVVSELINEWDGKNQQAFIGAMHVAGSKLAREIAEAYDLTPYRKLLDIGGASGTYTIAFLRKNPEMTAALFDLEPVIPMAQERLAAEGLLERVELITGDFYRDELPQGSDIALLSAIIHQNSLHENLELYRKILRALIPGGVVLIRDHIMDESRIHPPAGALFALNMLVNTRGGDTYTFPEVKDSLLEAGFTDVKWVRVGERMDSLVEARKPQ
jgi:SAM-dependent methyltransferase